MSVGYWKHTARQAAAIAKRKQLVKTAKGLLKSALGNRALNLAARSICRAFLRSRWLPFTARKSFESLVAWGIPPQKIGSFQVRLLPGKSISLCGPIDDQELRDFYWWGCQAHEPETLRLFCRMVKGAKVFLDIGCNIGIYSLAAARLNPNLLICSFEPVPEIFEQFARNLALNRMAGRIRAERLAVSDKCGQAKMYVSKGTISSSSLNPSFREHQGELTVETVTVDEYLRINDIPDPDLVKIDVETQEPMVLEGMRGVLSRGKTEIICEVLDGADEGRMTEILRPYGYGFYFITAFGLVKQEAIARRNDIEWRSLQNTPYYNYLFTRKPMPHVNI